MLEVTIGLILVTILGKGSCEESATSIGESDLDKSGDVCLRNRRKMGFKNNFKLRRKNLTFTPTFVKVMKIYFLHSLYISDI